MIQTGSLMTTGEFPWSDRITLANDINEGLSYLHSSGIFHRDLTSKVLMFYFHENIILLRSKTGKHIIWNKFHFIFKIVNSLHHIIIFRTREELSIYILVIQIQNSKKNFNFLASTIGFGNECR